MADDPTPPMPDVMNIPRATLEGWLSIPSHEEVQVVVTRHDLDNLFFSINHLVSANTALQQCLIAYSNGDLDTANRLMAESQRSNIQGLNALRMLFNALMSNIAGARKR